MNKQQNPLQIRVGDTVMIYFDHERSLGRFLAEVTAVIDRTMMGQDAYIDYRPEESGRNLRAEKLNISYGCSVSHVIEVVKRARYHTSAQKPTPANVFRDEIKRGKVDQGRHGWHGYYRFGGVRVSYNNLEALVILALASAKDTLDRPMDIERFRTLWANDGYRGKVAMPILPMFENEFDDEHNPYVAVRWSVFKRYVLANRQRILLSRKEMVKSGREFNDAMWSNDDVERDFDLRFSSDLDSESEDRRQSEDTLAWAG